MRTDFSFMRILLSFALTTAFIAAGGPLQAQETTGDLQLSLVDSRGGAIPEANAAVAGPNPCCGLPIRYPPVMSVRLGMEVKF